MILYFDSYITDIPLNKSFVDANGWIRQSVKNYAMPKKVDIAKYTLASYAVYNWSNVLIRYELDEGEDYGSFDSFILSLFPRAVIMHERSDSQADFKKSLEILNSWEDNWIFYAGNNDHPLTTPDATRLDEAVRKAEQYVERYPYISIPYSHLSEYANMSNVGSPSRLMIGLDVEKIAEDEEVIVSLKREGENSAVQIVNKKLFNYWFGSRDFDGRRIIRSEDVKKYLLTRDQLMVVMKKEICAHFDGYSHTHRGINEITAAQVPPLFIPAGFFEKKIKIAYGYSDYRDGWTNINPAAAKYSFEDPVRGTDLKISLEDLPLFWQERIAEIDSNPNLSASRMEAAARRQQAVVYNPWSFGHRNIDLGYLFFGLRVARFNVKSILKKINYNFFVPLSNRLFSLRRGMAKRRIARSGKPRPYHGLYVTGDSIAANCDHIFSRNLQVENIKKGDSVCVSNMNQIEDFFVKIHPMIKEEYVLVIVNGDREIGSDFLTYLDEKIIKCFARNVAAAHQKLVPLPIGIENYYMANNGRTEIYDRLRKRGLNKIKNRILFGFSIHTNPAERQVADNYLNCLSQADRVPVTMASPAYLKLLSAYKFVASPPGNGIDCIRTWEALYLKTVPIVKRSITTEYFSELGLPLWLIDSWNELDAYGDKELAEKYESFQDKFENKALSWEYWAERFKKGE